MKTRSNKIIFLLSFLSLILIINSSFQSLSDHIVYSGETPAWQVQCYGQDWINLILIAPCLLLSALLLLKGHRLGSFLWPGVVLYVIYTYLIYCFDVHFNRFFVHYVVILGLNFYSLAVFLITAERTSGQRFIRTPVTKATAVYFMLVSFIFYAIWLLQIIPAIRLGVMPNGLEETGLTNPVHVLDLAIVLPFIFIEGFMLFTRKSIAVAYGAPLLVFCMLMDVTIVVLNFMITGTTSGLSLVFMILTGITALLLLLFIRAVTTLDHSKKKTV